jgi:hypothetical protein
MNSWLEGEIVEGSPQWIAKRDELLSRWQSEKLLLDRAKADELKHRLAFVRFAFNKEKLEGTERIELRNGFVAKAVKNLRYIFVSREEGETVEEALKKAIDDLVASGPEGVFVANRLIKFTAELQVGEYKKLPARLREIMDRVIDTREGTPTLEIIPPKGTDN